MFYLGTCISPPKQQNMRVCVCVCVCVHACAQKLNIYILLFLANLLHAACSTGLSGSSDHAYYHMTMHTVMQVYTCKTDKIPSNHNSVSQVQPQLVMYANIQKHNNLLQPLHIY